MRSSGRAVQSIWSVITSGDPEEPESAGSLLGSRRRCDIPVNDGGFTRQEIRRLRALRSPVGIQRALDAMPYHLAKTAWSPRRVLRERTAHCLEGAIFAAAALRVLGFPPLLLDLEAVQDTDHVIAVYRLNGHWGAIAKSNFSGLRFRAPVYRSLRELTMSYFEDYINLRGDRTLRAYSRPVNLARFDRVHPGWMIAQADLWWVPEYLVGIPHRHLLAPGMERSLSRADRRALEAGLVGYRAR
jgi:hypothetical protein